LGLYWMLRRRFGSLTTTTFVWSLVRIGVAAGLMGGAARGTYQLLVAQFPENSLRHELLSVLVPIGVAMAVYPALALVLRLEDAHQLLGILRRRLPGPRR